MGHLIVKSHSHHHHFMLGWKGLEGIRVGIVSEGYDWGGFARQSFQAGSQCFYKVLWVE